MQKSWKNSLIKRGDIWIAKLEPSFGKEIKKQRPVLVVSGNKFNEAPRLKPWYLLNTASQQKAVRWPLRGKSIHPRINPWFSAFC